jgi:hypothetical protein
MKDQVIAAQRKILNDLAAQETMIGELYDAYAVLHPTSSSLWSTLAKEERMHASMLLTILTKMLDAGHLFWNIGQFNDESVAKELELIRDALYRVRNAKPSEYECITTAIQIENTLLDSKFYSVVTSDAKEFATICQTLTKETEKHIQRLKDKLAEATSRYEI